ncbi:carbamoyltransferase HypF [Salmonella enterica]|nr:carbamoyltransferase HypF [Salmonella enterica]
MYIHKQIRVNGVVQGVGFRPFVHKTALINGLFGWVLNDSQGVLIVVQGRIDNYNNFKRQLLVDKPPMAKIVSFVETSLETDSIKYTSFIIKESLNKLNTTTLVPPDSNVCPDCIREMFDRTNRRYSYPFINCTNCGPRFSLIKDMPYDRKNTTMSSFSMCQTCLAEYQDVTDRRYHAQPNACPDCGPRAWLADTTGQEILHPEPLAQARLMLRDGKILAVKSLGGFHLSVDATQENVIKLLRQRKRRDDKPFAIMVKDIATVRHFCEVSTEEEHYLQSHQRPIVILKKRSDCSLPDAIAPASPSLGIMLPSAPLHYLLLDDDALPALVMTSANRSGNPIVFRNEDAVLELGQIADVFLLHNRDIHTRVDDSLVRLVPTRDGETLTTFIRRSRGYAPYPVNVGQTLRPIMAVGAELKTTLALSKDEQVYLSQHIGDLKNDKAFDAHELCGKTLGHLLDIQPIAWAADMHPQFRSTRQIEENSKFPLYRVQHHHAHMASCMAENGLQGLTIGVVFDGTGYGDDGTIWGGEFLLGDYKSTHRIASLYPFGLPGGDKAVKEPYRVALSLLFETFGDNARHLPLPFLSELPTDQINVLMTMLSRGINTVKTSSMGRLFDGLSALIGVRSKIEYEAQAAIELEGVLNRDLSGADIFAYDFVCTPGMIQLDYRPMIAEIVDCIIKGSQDAAHLSRRFHSTIVAATLKLCQRLSETYNTKQFVLSGGVFMNEYLLANTYTALKKSGFSTFVQQQVPANDGGIALGQLMVANAQMESK